MYITKLFKRLKINKLNLANLLMLARTVIKVKKYNILTINKELVLYY
jgi:hypothetical protein